MLIWFFSGSIDTYKVSAIQTWTQATTLSENQSYHGVASFCRYFVPHFSSIMAPLTDCIRTGTFTWTIPATNAFNVIKDKLCSAPIILLYITHIFCYYIHICLDEKIIKWIFLIVTIYFRIHEIIEKTYVLFFVYYTI